MQANKKFKFIIPFIILFTLLGLLGWELFYGKTDNLTSALIDSEVPAFKVPNLFHSQPDLTNTALSGRFLLLNVWATWCYACKEEHEMLMKIKNQYHIPIYGLVYKDKTANAIEWLQQHGNPYTSVGNDAKGDVAIDLGVYGTPETFVINAQGKIIYRHVGALTQAVWDNTLYPLINSQGK